MGGLLEKLLLQYKWIDGDVEVLVVAVRQPSGAVETITNTTHIPEKIAYYREVYDSDFRLKSNPEVHVIGFLLV